MKIIVKILVRKILLKSEQHIAFLVAGISIVLDFSQVSQSKHKYRTFLCYSTGNSTGQIQLSSSFKSLSCGSVPQRKSQRSRRRRNWLSYKRLVEHCCVFCKHNLFCYFKFPMGNTIPYFHSGNGCKSFVVLVWLRLLPPRNTNWDWEPTWYFFSSLQGSYIQKASKLPKYTQYNWKNLAPNQLYTNHTRQILLLPKCQFFRYTALSLSLSLSTIEDVQSSLSTYYFHFPTHQIMCPSLSLCKPQLVNMLNTGGQIKLL